MLVQTTPAQQIKTFPMTELILIRHGETAWNAERRIQGQLDVPLNEVGRAQAEAIGQRFRNETIDVLISSDLSRAMQTMQPIANACGLQVLSDSRLRERHLGVLEGLFYEEAQRKMPQVLDVFQSRKVDTSIDGGESLREFAQRVIAVLTETVETHAGKHIVAVTHGGVVDIACRHANGTPLGTPRGFPIHNTSVSTFHVDDSGFILVDEADLSHLPARMSIDDA
jgi:probable phosphoglycerate mutase